MHKCVLARARACTHARAHTHTHTHTHTNVHAHAHMKDKLQYRSDQTHHKWGKVRAKDLDHKLMHVLLEQCLDIFFLNV